MQFARFDFDDPQGVRHMLAIHPSFVETVKTVTGIDPYGNPDGGPLMSAITTTSGARYVMGRDVEDVIAELQRADEAEHTRYAVALEPEAMTSWDWRGAAIEHETQCQHGIGVHTTEGRCVSDGCLCTGWPGSLVAYEALLPNPFAMKLDGSHRARGTYYPGFEDHTDAPVDPEAEAKARMVRVIGEHYGDPYCAHEAGDHDADGNCQQPHCLCLCWLARGTDA